MFKNYARGAKRRLKSLLQSLRPTPSNKLVLFIVGCQRSGTTHLSRIFEKDWNSKTYGEASELSGNNPYSRLRLNPMEDVANQIEAVRASLVVLKPLVESQNILKLLNYFPKSSAIWIYRNYKDVAASNAAKFGTANATKDLKAIASDDANNWRSELISEESRSLVQQYYDSDMNPADAAVLFWIVRNRLYFDLELQKENRIYLCRYENLTKSPVHEMRSIYDFMQRSYPGDSITTGTHSDSVRKGASLQLTPAIESIAEELLARIDAETQS